ncbi:selenocysteine lyase-like isoform X2 [Ailuropoda melanoleuca]|uniref:selenocysteine lyase-like isoform X2 n=1 Tax=Ailuropoda melanoleuca TaxID=9646 RepID=UPI001494894E|nr:selenocysteine lyase-like isoform X2 [Ailuropoda melanoleuca]
MEAVAAPGRDARGRAASHPRGRGEKSPPDRKVYMDYNATTPLEPEVIQAMTEAMREAWGNPSSPYPAGRKAKDIIDTARENIAKMIGGRPQDIIFTSGGTEKALTVKEKADKSYHHHHHQTDCTSSNSPMKKTKDKLDSGGRHLQHITDKSLASGT